MATELELYDPESAFEAAIKSLLTDAGLDCLTRADASVQNPPRPRVEIVFQVGAESETYRRVATGRDRNISWDGTLIVAIVTDYDATGAAHRTYRAKVRAKCAEMRAHLADDNFLRDFAVTRFVGTGTTATIKEDDNDEVSNLQYSVHFNIRTGAWPADI